MNKRQKKKFRKNTSEMIDRFNAFAKCAKYTAISSFNVAKEFEKCIKSLDKVKL